MTRDRVRRSLLGTVLVVVALNAVGGGIYGIAGAPGVPVAWLAGTPFRSYVIPSVLLFVVVGGTSLLGAVTVFTRAAAARTAALGAGAILMIWIVVQVTMIGYVSWLQPAMALTAVLVTALARQLPRRT